MYNHKLFKISLFLMTLILGACQKELLNPVPQSVLTTSNFFQTSKDMDLAILGIYSQLQSMVSSDRSVLLDLISDESYLGEFGSPQGEHDLDNVAVTSDNELVANFWENAYNGIFRANSVLSNIDNPTNYKTSEKDQYIGEAKFMRALFYFDLVRLFGGVPKVISLLSINEAKLFTRATEEDIYNLIVEDLQDALAKLPDQTGIARGRASKGAALALLGKVSVYRKDWSNAKVYLEQLFSDFNYALVPDFAEVIKTEDNSELIFAVKYTDGGNGQFVTNLYTPFVGIYGLVSGGGNHLPSWSTEKLYQTGDTRKDATITDLNKYYFAQPGDPYVWYPHVNKYLVPHTMFVGCGLDIPILRLGDMVLLYSEVLYELQQPELALIQLNAIRERAFGDATHDYTLADISSRDSFIDKLFLERHLELAWENERWFDIVRNGTFLTALAQEETYYNDATQTTFIITRTILPYMKYFPIPQRQIEQSDPGVLIQNEGY